jgi:hypothetical protein
VQEVTVSELRFLFEEMHREVGDFYSLAKSFLSPSADDCLRAFASRLLTIRSNAPLANNPPEVVNRKYRWEIPGHQPLLTKSSRRYEKGKRQGRLEIVGRLTTVWEITPDPKASKMDTPRQFRLSGKASVVVEWVDPTSHQTLVQWNVDVAAPPGTGEPAPPGCMIHTQIDNPSRLPVPRLPCIVFTPLAVAEFVLSELFQDEWERHCLGTACENWAATQKRRLSALLAWQQQVVDGAAGPPWTALKRERLPHDRFVATK